LLNSVIASSISFAILSGILSRKFCSISVMNDSQVCLVVVQFWWFLVSYNMSTDGGDYWCVSRYYLCIGFYI
jgi:hypothetical protein